MFEPLVSVIVPVYNVELYLNKCIDSILEQTYSNIEVIIIDDGSEDSSSTICDYYRSKDNRVKVIHQENRGLSAARNVGINSCMGEFILFVDSDDWIDEEMINKLVQSAEEYSSDIVCCGWQVHNENSVIVPQYLTDVPFIVPDNRRMPELLKGKLGHAVWNKLWRASLFLDNNIFFPAGKVYEDSATTWRVMRHCNSVACIPGAFYHYVIRSGSIIHIRSLTNICNYWTVMKERFDAFEQWGNQECYHLCLGSCFVAAGFVWRWAFGSNREERNEKQEVFIEICEFVNKHKSEWKKQSLKMRAQMVFASHYNEVSLFGCFYLNQLYRLLTGRRI